MDELLKDLVNRKIENIEGIRNEDIPVKSLNRIMRAEEIIQQIEESIKNYIFRIKENKLSISLFSNNKRMDISRRSIYSDEYLLAYLNEAIKKQDDYLNEKKVSELEGKIKCLEETNGRIIDNIIEIYELKKVCKDYELTIEELIEENKNLRVMVEEQRKRINYLKPNDKSAKIVSLEENFK